MAHGFTDNGRCWEPLVSALADAGHCVFRDQFDAAYAELRTVLRRV